MGHEGTVVLLLRVGASGQVTRVEVVASSGHEELDTVAADAAKLWQFEPARRDGEPVAFDVRVPIEFRLTDA
jgi:protein TonB